MLRDYQEEAVAACRSDLAENSSTLVSMATGLGKTVVMIEMIRSCISRGGRAMLVAHRDELIRQPEKRIVDTIGVIPGIEKAEQKSECFDKIVIASIQTLVSGPLGIKRYTKFDPNDFNLLLIDEAHHAASPSYREFIKYMQDGNPRLKLVGVTATPDRGDRVGMHNVFDTCSYEYNILDGINDGWLVPIKQRFVQVGTLDYSKVKTVGGELCGAELAEILEEEKNLHGMVHPTLELVGDRQTIIFAGTVRQARLICDIINRHKPGAASWVSGKTPSDERRELLAKFAGGEIQFVVNVQVLVEGFDAPPVAAVCMMTATKVRAKYTQCVGRGTRPTASLPYDSSAMTRKDLIAASNKPDLMVLDFKGNAGRHRLITTFDVLAGEDAKDLPARAAEMATEGELLDPIEEMEKARIQEEAAKESAEAAEQEKLRRAKLKLASTYTSRSINPFDDMGFAPVQPTQKVEMATTKQMTFLANQGVDPEGLTRKQAGGLIGQIMMRRKMGKASLRQEALLKKYGLPTDVSAKAATRMIQDLADNGWKIESPTR
jgi:superfamily II DNA or RNA helicase